MARSVDYLTNALHVAFFAYPTYSVYAEDENEQPVEAETFEEWDIVRDDLVDCIQKVAPSLGEPGGLAWDGRETQIILKNSMAEIGISEYCGLMSLSIRIAPDCSYPGLAGEWIEKTWASIRRAVPYEHYEKVGTFSNGEGIYKKAS